MPQDSIPRKGLYFIVYAVGLLAALPILAYPAGIRVNEAMMLCRAFYSPVLLAVIGVALLTRRSWLHRSSGLVLLLIDVYWAVTLYREL